jgi:hypothetical protein
VESGSDSESGNDGWDWGLESDSPAVTAHDEEYDFVHAALPSNAVLREAVRRILREANLEATGMTPADLRHQVEREFGLPQGTLDNHRARIRSWIDLQLLPRSESPQSSSIASDHTWTFSPISPTCVREPGDDGWRRVLRADHTPRPLATQEAEQGDGGGYDNTPNDGPDEDDGGWRYSPTY